MSASAIIASIITGGTNVHTTVSEEANAYATDFVAEGILGSFSNTGGASPSLGSFAVNADSVADMGVTIKGTGNTQSGVSVAYILGQPTNQGIQVIRARMSSDYTNFTINSNSSGATRWDWIYLKFDPANGANPDIAGDNVITLVTSRSTSSSSDNGSPPTYAILLAVVTVANGATSITSGNISDRRTQTTLNVGSTSNSNGWQTLNFPLVYSANNGAKEFQATSNNDLTGVLSPGMKLRVNRSITPQTQCMAFIQASSQYASKASPTGLSFTTAFTCEAWIKQAGYSGALQSIISRFDGTNGFLLYLGASGQLFCQVGSTTSANTYESIRLNEWTHVAGTFSSGTFALYIDGKSVAMQSTGSSTSLTQAGPLQIAALNSTDFFSGSISEARVWSVAQTQSAIQSNMSINLIGNEANLVTCIPGSGSFTDITTNANTLTAQNSAIATQSSNPFRASEYATIRAISYSNPTTTITLFTPGGSLPNQTLNNPAFSTDDHPFGLPEALNTKILGKVLWCTNQTNTATGGGTPVTGGSITITNPADGKMLVLKAYATSIAAGSGTPLLGLYNGSTQVQQYNGGSIGAYIQSAPFLSPSGSQTFTFDQWQTGSGTNTLFAGTASPAFFTVEEA